MCTELSRATIAVLHDPSELQHLRRDLPSRGMVSMAPFAPGALAEERFAKLGVCLAPSNHV
jgi:hypothetical protein